MSASKIIIKPSKEITFECKEYKLFYEELQKQIEDDVCPEIKAAEKQLGFHHTYLSSSKQVPWKIQMRKEFKKAASEWKNNRECLTAKKFEKELQAVINAEEEPIQSVLCRRVGVSIQYLKFPQSTWLKKIKKDVLKSREHWEEEGGKHYKELKAILKAMEKEGERPVKNCILVKSGRGLSYFRGRNLFPWKIKLLKEIEKAEVKWLENGGIEYKKLKKALIGFIKLGEQLSILLICNEAGYKQQNLQKPKFPWQAKIVVEIKEASVEWGQHGGSAYKKCKDTLYEIVKVGEIPNPSSVAVKAGFNPKYLTQCDFPWKQKILIEIEEAVSAGLEELKIMFVDLDTLIHNIVEKEDYIGDYRRLGVFIKNAKIDYVDKYNLAHIMYGTHHLGKSVNSDIKKIFVDQESYDENRKIYIDGIIRACEGLISYSNLAKYIPQMAVAAIWLGNKIPSNTDEAKQAFRNYSNYLHKMLKSTEIKHPAAHKYQNSMLKLLAGMFCVDESKITEDSVSLLISQKAPKSNAFSNSSKFTQEELAYAFAFYYHLFDQIADFLLESKSYPHIIQLPRGNATILGVSTTMIAAVYEMPGQGSIAIDYNDGHILTDKEIEDIVVLVPKYKQTTVRKDYRKSRKKSLKQLTELNSDFKHPKRLQLGKKAMDAWFMCMLYLTTSNDSTLSNYEWSEKDDYETEHDERKEFITIKPRAKNKTIRLTIPKVFMSSFQKAIKLRRFVLDGYDFPYLFFASGYSTQARRTKRQVSGGMGAEIASKMIKSIDSELPRVGSRASRKDGARDALENHGVEVALAVLQNEKDTLFSHYNGHTAEELASDLSELMQSLHNVISGKPIDQKQQNAMGGCGCEGELKPETFSDKSPVKAECLDQKSCIFCIHFVTFPEPEEIRKLISLKYLIENVAYDRTGDEAFYNKEMNPWLKRIEFILVRVVEKEPKAEAMIEKVRIEVYEEGLLSPYWLEWVDLLDELGRLS